AALPLAGAARRHGSHAVFTIGADPPQFAAWLWAHHPELGLFGFGERIEVFKDVGSPEAVTRRFGLDRRSGTHALGHTRMATESAVTTEHSYPFSPGGDFSL